ncbi:cytochrome b/b6 domain-containing protein [Prolixibacter denitrificans]|jgi:cytochrome b561|uniref:Cytochrome b561 n=1 Tax=Prolixibacter denitrificans TaxID=1541063 RepID=A0A2P8C5S6_9BACT|nr:cytochrome b/b6 domain-containing protein [Prolixibacter denitrificans]PSK80308.1 cytochrome b561 [Prolixibacter denitrificans]GET23118.1 hypothetical protein JCM18694_33640 [Prolixibacter denitrificans]
MEKTTYSKIYRVIHWAIGISFLLLLITIFLRSTWLSNRHMAGIIENYLKGAGVTLTRRQIFGLAHQIQEPMWQWHIYLGYILTGLFTIRFTLPLFGEMKFQNPLGKGLSAKEKLKKWTYIVFYVLVVASLTTGLLMEWGPGNWRRPLEEIHQLSIYYLLTFIVIHWAGVFIAEFTDEKGIVSRIVSGVKKE